MKYPSKVTIGDVTIRDGFQHEEKYIPLEAKIWLAEELILSGIRKLELTNLGNPKGMPQFKDAEELLRAVKTSKRIAHLLDETTLTAVTIRERAVDRAIEYKQKGFGPDRILLMVSTSESHQKINSGLSIDEYWRMAEQKIKEAKDHGIQVNGTVSTIWGCPVEGPTDLNKAIEFTQRWLDIGADDIEHADHDGSASPDKVYRYYSDLLNAIPHPEKHIAHFHTTRGWGTANVLAALQAGIIHYEATLGGIGGQPANFVDGIPVRGTGAYYYKNPNDVGLVSTEDILVMMDEMGIETNIDIDRILELGLMNERIVGRKLRAESIRSGRVKDKIKAQ